MRGDVDNFRAGDALAAVEFTLRLQLATTSRCYIRSKRLADRIGLTTKQTANALRFLMTDDTATLTVEQWSSPGTYPKTWEVSRAE